MQRFIGNHWPTRLWMGVVPLAVPAAVVWYAAPWRWLQASWLNGSVFAGLLLVAWLAGWFVALLAGWPVLGPLYHAQGLRNGAPYFPGDFVRILSGRHRAEVGRVEETWDDPHALRVQLGDDERRRCADICSYHEVCREPKPG